MSDTQVVLLVDIFQLRVKVGAGQRRGECITGAGEVQAVAAMAHAGAGLQVQLFVVGGVTRADLRKPAGGQRQAVDFLGFEQGTAVGRDQLARIVNDHHGQKRPQLTDFQLGFRVAHFQRHTAAAVFIGLLLAALAVRDDRVIASPATAVQAKGVLRLCIEAKLHRTFGIAGGETQVETLGPAAHSRMGRVVFFVIPINVKVARTQRQLAVIDHICLCQQWRQQANCLNPPNEPSLMQHIISSPAAYLATHE
ncbi:hypothetical protein D3C81_1080090 [compost metagenome]